MISASTTLLIIGFGLIAFGAFLMYAAYQSGKETFHEVFPDNFSPDEHNVRRLPEIDLPLDDPYRDDLDH